MFKLTEQWIMKHIDGSIDSWNTHSLKSVQIKQVEALELDQDRGYTELHCTLRVRLRLSEEPFDTSITIMVTGSNDLTEDDLNRERLAFNEKLAKGVTSFDYWKHTLLDVVPQRTPFAVFTSREMDKHIIAAYDGTKYNNTQAPPESPVQRMLRTDLNPAVDQFDSRNPNRLDKLHQRLEQSGRYADLRSLDFQLVGTIRPNLPLFSMHLGKLPKSPQVFITAIFGAVLTADDNYYVLYNRNTMSLEECIASVHSIPYYNRYLKKFLEATDLRKKVK